MNETRKEIINLIEPFMEKELSERCYIRPKSFKGIIEKYLYWSAWVVIKLNYENKISYWIMEDFKIIGNYDITAVLKYIANSGKAYTCIEKNTFEIELKNREWYINIPNKPLHLYTEEQETELLNLLNKLK